MAVSPDRGEVAYVDATGLHVINARNNSIERADIDVEACEPVYLAVAPRTLSYFSPCAERRLVIVDLESGNRTVHADNVISERLLMGFVFFLTPPAELWVVPDGGTPIHVGSGADLNRIFLRTFDEFFVFLDSDGQTVRLGLWNTESGFSELFSDVSGVHSRHGYLAVIVKTDDDLGTLTLMRNWDLHISMSAANVAEGSVQFALDKPFMGYIAQYDASERVGRFEVWLMFLERGFIISENVSEFHEVFWPNRGVVYAVGAGKTKGIWQISFGDMEE